MKSNSNHSDHKSPIIRDIFSPIDISLGTLCIYCLVFLLFVIPALFINFEIKSDMSQQKLFCLLSISTFIGGFSGILKIKKMELPFTMFIKQNQKTAVIFGYIELIIFWSICLFCVVVLTFHFY